MNFDLNLPLCRATDPVESFMAVDQAADLIKSHERLIVAALEQHGPCGVDAIARLCKLTWHAVGKRVSALHTSGRIELTGRSVKSDSGRMQREWRVASA